MKVFWVLAAKVAQVLGIDRRTLWRQIKQGKYQYRLRKTNTGHGKGGLVYEVNLYDFSPEVIKRYLEMYCEELGVPPEARVFLEEEKEQRPLPEGSTLEILRGRNKKRFRAMVAWEVDKAMGRHGAVRRLAEKYKVSVKTLYRWRDEWLKSGGAMDYEAPRCSRMFSTDESAWYFFLNIMLTRKKPSIRQAYRITKAKALEEGWRIGSYATFARHYAEEREDIKVYAREGRQEWQKRYMPKGRRDRLFYRSNQEFTADHTQLNIMVRWENGRMGRPWITAIMDVRSGCIMGFALAEVPSGDSIAEAARHAFLAKEPFPPERNVPRALADWFREFYEKYHQIRNPLCGIPEVFYFDNGKDFRGKRFWDAGWDEGKVLLEEEGLVLGGFRSLGIAVKHSTAYCPWAKGMIEGFFPYLRAQIQALPGAWKNQNPRKQDRERAESDIRQGRVLTIRMLYPVIDMITMTWNALRDDGGKSKLDLWAEGVPEQGVRVVSGTSLDFCLMRHEIRTVSAKGIQFQNEYYEHERLWAFVGKQVEIRYDRLNPAEIYVYDAKGNYICTARSMFWIRYREDLEKIKRTQAHTERDIKDTIKTIREKGGVDPEKELMNHLIIMAEEVGSIPRMKVKTQTIRTRFDGEMTDEEVQETFDRITLEDLLRQDGEEAMGL